MPPWERSVLAESNLGVTTADKRCEDGIAEKWHLSCRRESRNSWNWRSERVCARSAWICPPRSLRRSWAWSYEAESPLWRMESSRYQWFSLNLTHWHHSPSLSPTPLSLSFLWRRPSRCRCRCYQGYPLTPAHGLAPHPDIRSIPVCLPTPLLSRVPILSSRNVAWLVLTRSSIRDAIHGTLVSCLLYISGKQPKIYSRFYVTNNSCNKMEVFIFIGS